MLAFTVSSTLVLWWGKTVTRSLSPAKFHQMSWKSQTLCDVFWFGCGFKHPCLTLISTFRVGPPAQINTETCFHGNSTPIQVNENSPSTFLVVSITVRFSLTFGSLEYSLVEKTELQEQRLGLALIYIAVIILVCRRNIFDWEVDKVVSVAHRGSSMLICQLPERNSSERERSVRPMLLEVQSMVWGPKIRKNLDTTS